MTTEEPRLAAVRALRRKIEQLPDSPQKTQALRRLDGIEQSARTTAS